VRRKSAKSTRGGPAGASDNRVARLAARIGPRWALALFCAAYAAFCWLITFGPYEHRFVDVRVYHSAAVALVQRHDIYAAGEFNFHFSYPPFAVLPALALAPLGKAGAVVVMTALSIAAIVVICRVTIDLLRPDLARNERWTLALLCAALAPILEPVYETLSFGQINLLLAAAVLYDVGARRGWRPHGALVGLMTAVKITPGLFILYLALTRRFKDALVAAGVAVGATALGFAVMPHASLTYWGSFTHEADRVGPIHYIANQSVFGPAARLSHQANGGRTAAIVVAAIVLCAGLVLAVVASRRGDELLGIITCALAGLVAAPISWSHHWVWALPLAIVLWLAAIRRPGALRWLGAAGWTLVFSLRTLWFTPREQDRELTQHGFQHVMANPYAPAAIAALIVIAVLLLRRVDEASRGTAGATNPAAPT